MKLIYYITIDFIAVGIVTVVPLFVLIGLILLYCVYLRSAGRSIHPNKESLRKRDEKGRKIIQFQIQFARAFFGDWVIHSEERDGKPIIMIFKKPFPLWALVMVTIDQVIIIAYVTAMFFDVLIVERSYKCDQNQVGYDCFIVYNASYFTDPINCSDPLFNSEEVKLVCSKFNFNFPVAAALAGGLLEFFPLLFTVPLFLIIKLANGNRCRQCSTYILQWIVFFVLLICGLTILGNETVRTYVIGIDIYEFFTFCSLFAIVLAVIVMPWSLFIKIKSYNQDNVTSLDESIQRAEKGFEEVIL